MSQEDFDAVLQVNLKGVFLVSKCAFRPCELTFLTSSCVLRPAIITNYLVVHLHGPE